MVEDYLKTAEECLDLFLRSCEVYLESSLSAEFEALVAQTHSHEAACDDIRRNIEQTLYEKALIPESRSDILNLLESLDKIPNKGESVLYQIETELLQMPQSFARQFRDLAHVNHQACQSMWRAVRALFTDARTVKALTDEVDRKESASDRMERNVIRALFSCPDLPDAQKVLLKELVIEIGNISDACENAADALVIIAVKRFI